VPSTDREDLMSDPAGPDALKARVDESRARLGRTVDQLGQRLDVPSRARARATESAYRARDTTVETYRERPPAVLGAGVALTGLVAGVITWRRRRSTPRRKR
jgi:ElaB/YqjD/DUF883 family membrane-anchored ribosome-binding protein